MQEYVYGYALIHDEFNKAQRLRKPYDAGQAEGNQECRMDQVPDDIFIVAIHSECLMNG